MRQYRSWITCRRSISLRAANERLVRDLVAGSGATAVFVGYEAHDPVAINQAYAATRWVAAHGAEIGRRWGRLAVLGNSVGGNMAAVIVLRAKDRGTPRIRCQVLLTDRESGRNASLWRGL